MALQLTGAFKEEALANLQAELPAVVIGGGLTAIDTATELLAYYPIQAEKTLARYETLLAERGEKAVRDAVRRRGAGASSTASSRTAPRSASERERARAAGEAPDLARLCREWGGVSIVYRRAMEESPAYRLNHEEVIKALEEGISFVEALEPDEAVPGRATATSPRCASCAAARAKSSSCPRGPASSRPGRRRTSPTRRSSRARFRSTRSGASSSPTGPSRRRGRLDPLEPAPGRRRGRLLHGLRARRKVRDVLRRQPPRLQRQRRQGDGLGQERLPRDRGGGRSRAAAPRPVRAGRPNGTPSANGSTTP